MAPGTNIGAATPVPLEGELPEELANKIIQDSAAYAEAIAELRGRDVDFVVDTVREGRSASANEALEIRPPETCAAYSATYEDGTSSGYEVRDLAELPTLGDESRGFAVDVDTDGERNHMYSVMYRNGDLVGTTSIMGPGELED
jgi:hypothetical protein